jgi:hypothetical protein
VGGQDGHDREIQETVQIIDAQTVPHRRNIACATAVKGPAARASARSADVLLPLCVSAVPAEK